MKANPGGKRRLFLIANKVVSIITLIFFSAGHVFALPAGQQVVNGQVGFATQGNNLTITNSPNAIINWQGFSINNNEAVRFIQQYGSSAVLNRVIGQDPSRILGLLQSNGRVFIINPNGILFGQGARIDVNGLVASTLNLSNQDFLAGKYNFNAGTIAGSIQNQGTITTPEGGKVYLIAPDVENSGIITSPKGDVMLAAGHSVQLVDSLNPDIAVVVSAPGNKAVNLGQIIAQSGKVGIYGGLISQKGVINADSAVSESGRIFLKSTKQTVLDPESRISADGIGKADGGKVIVWSDGDTQAAGMISAKGGKQGGNGGFIETSGKTIDFSKVRIDASATTGLAGTWLIDPDELTIGSVGATALIAALDNGTTGTNTTVTSSSSSFGTVNASGDGDINLDSAVSWTKSSSLTLNSSNGININANLTGAAGNITLNAGGAITQSQSAAITTGLLTTSSVGGTTLGAANMVTNFNATNTTRGNISLTNTAAPLVITGISQSGGGNIAITNSGAITTSGSITTASNGNISLTATGGAETIGALITAGGSGSLTLNAGGAITQSAAISAGLLTTSSVGGTTLGAANTVTSFNATNTTTGDISLTNTAAPLTITGISQSGGGTVAVTNTGGITTTGPISVGSGATLTATGMSSNINVNDAISWNANKLTLTAGKDVNINAVMTASDTASLDLAPVSNKVNVGFNSDGNFKGKVNFSGTGDLTINNDVYTVITTLDGLYSGSGHYALGSDIIESPESQRDSSPVSSFSGIFDGLGHTINNLAILHSGTGYIGLFGTNSGFIKNVGLVDVDITGKHNVGALVGYNTGGTISNSYSTGSVKGTQDGSSTSNYGDIGGLVGDNNSGTISNSYSTATVIGTVANVSDIGGLVGENHGTINNSYSTGAVGTTGYGGSAFGGLVGWNNGTISNSYSTGAVGATGYGGSSYGGLVGYGYGGSSINNSYSTGAVTAGAAGYGGGLVGYNQGAIEYSYSTGVVTVGTAGYGGGLVGYSNHAIENNYWAATTENITNGIGYYTVASGASDTGAAGRTTAEMKLSSTFTSGNWDFHNTAGVWGIVPGHTYPFLTSLNKAVYGTLNTGGEDKAIAIAVNGGNLSDSVIVENDGFYYSVFKAGSLQNNDALLVYVSSSGDKASAVHLSDGGYVTNLSLTSNTLSTSNIGDISYATFNKAKGNLSPSDVLYSVSDASGLALGNGYNFLVTNNGAITQSIPVNTSGGSFTVAGSTGGSTKAASFTSGGTGTITTTGITGKPGGSVSIQTTGAIVTQAITTTGGVASTSGNAGGAVTLKATDGAITTGAINTSGSSSSNQKETTSLGGAAGSVTIQVDTPTVARAISVGAITAKGGASGSNVHGDGGGTGGIVTVSTTTNGAVNTAGIDTSGGEGGTGSSGYGGYGGAGGAAGTITVRSFGASNNTTITGNLVSAGGTGGAAVSGLTTGAGGAGGTFVVSSDLGSVSMLAFNQGGGQAGTGGGTLGATGVSATGNTVTGPAGVTINAGSGAIKLSGVAVSNGGGASTGAITLTADRMALSGETVNAGAGTLWLKPSTANWNIDLGSSTDAATSTLELSAAELNTLTGTGTLRIGAMTAGNLNLSGPVAPTGGYSTTGTLSFESGGAITQATSTDIITASKLAIKSIGSVTLDTAPNLVGTLAGSIIGEGTKDFYFKNNKTLTIGTVDSRVGITASGTITLKTTTGDITLNNPITSSATGNAIVLAANGNFINNAGDSALNPGSGRWLVYSTEPESNSFGSLNSGQYALWYKTFATYAPGSVTETGSRYLFSYRPTLSFSASTNASKTYGETATLPEDFIVTAHAGIKNAFAADKADSTYKGAPSFASDGTSSAAKTGNYEIIISEGSLESLLGYASEIKFKSTGVLTVNQANIFPFSHGGRFYDGTSVVRAEIFTGGSSGFITGVNGEILTLTGIGTVASKNVGTYPVTLGSLALGNGSGSASNYKLATSNLWATITPRPLTVTATGVSKVYDGLLSANVTYAYRDDGMSSYGSYLVTGDLLSIGGKASFLDKNVGTGKTVNVSGITLGGADAGNYTLSNTTAITTADITKASLSITGLTANNKVYDGTTVATLTGALTGVITGDIVSLGTPTGTFDSKNVGTGKTVNISGVELGGADAGNYTLATTTASTTADITQASLGITGLTAQNKVYDATTVATLTGGTLTGVITGDIVSLGTPKGTFDNKNVGTGKPVSISGIALGGADAGNYTLTDATASTTANISAAALTVSAAGQNKVYDATATARVSLSDNRLGSDALTLAYGSAAFNNKNVGTGKPIVVNGITLTGLDAGNYTFNTTAATTANITPAALTTSGAVAQSKVYDTTTAATITGQTLVGVFAGDTVSVSGSGTFANKNVATGKTVTAALTLSGTDSSNYSLSQPSGLTANITPASLTVSATGQNKVYDATTATSVSLSDNRLGSDVLTLDYDSAAFNDKNVGTGKSVGVNGITLTGTDAGNYTFNTTAATTANITPAMLTITAATNTKGYDRTTSAAAKPTITLGSLLGGDTATLTEVYDSKIAGTGKTLTPTAVISDGNSGNNYLVTYVNNTTGVIDPGQIVSGKLDVASAGKTIDFAVNGTQLGLNANGTFLPDQATTDTSGNYSVMVPLNSVPSNSALLAYVAGDSGIKSASVSLAAGGDIANLLLAANTVTANSGGAISNTIFGNAKGSLASTDIPYSVSGNNVTLGSGINLTMTAVGDMTLNGLVDAGTGNIALKSGGAIINGMSGARSINAGSLAAEAANGIGSGNALMTGVNKLTALNTTANHIQIDNTGVLAVTGMKNLGTGNVILQNVGAITTDSSIVTASGGSVSITAHSPLTIGSGGVSAAGNISLEAASSGGTDNLTINGTLASSGGGIALKAGSGIVVGPGGGLSAPKGTIILTDNLNTPAAPKEAGNVTAADNTIVALKTTEGETIAKAETKSDSEKKKEDEEEKKKKEGGEQKTDEKKKDDDTKKYCN